MAEAVERRKKTLVQDDDGHWYLINYRDRLNFQNWLYYSEDDKHSPLNYPDFEACRINYPEEIIIIDYIKESDYERNLHSLAGVTEEGEEIDE